jgi:hypothetical protein
LFLLHQINSAEQRIASISLLLHELHCLISQNVTLSASALATFPQFTPPLSSVSPVSGTFQMLVYQISDVLTTMKSLNFAQQSLLYNHQPDQDQYFYGNLCVQVASVCPSWQSGLMTLGLVPALLSFDTRVRAILDSLSVLPVSFAAANASLYSSEVQFVRDFALLYAPPSLDASLHAYVLSKYHSFQSLYNVRVGILISFMTIVVPFFFLFLYRRVHTLNAESRRIGAIFLTIPTAVLDSMSKTANLQSLLEQIVTPEDD